MSKTIPTYILTCTQLVAICMYKKKKTYVTLDEIYKEFINLNEKLHNSKYKGFVLYSNVYINEMLHDYSYLFNKCGNTIGLQNGAGLQQLCKEILAYMSYDILELTLEDAEKSSTNLDK